MKVNYEQFKRCFPYEGVPSISKETKHWQRVSGYYPYIILAIESFKIEKVSEFLATLGHESGGLRYSEEIASGEAYESRTDLGNTKEKDGDGPLYKGRGPIQITGRAMYKIIGDMLKLDLIADPRKLIEPQYGSLAAGAFWTFKKLDAKPTFLAISKAVNGVNRQTGLPNGWSDRVRRLKICRLALNEESQV